MFNPHTRKVYTNWLAKMPETFQKYGIKLVSACTVLSEQLTVFILDAPSLEALQRMEMEPEHFAVNMIDTIEVKPALNMEEGIKAFQQQSQVAPIPV